VPDRFFEHLFDAAPSLRELLPQDLPAPKEHLLDTLALIAGHSAALGSLRARLADAGALLASRGIKPVHLFAARDALVATLAEAAGERWTRDLAEAWFDALGVAAFYMIGGADSSLVSAKAA